MLRFLFGSAALFAVSVMGLAWAGEKPAEPKTAEAQAPVAAKTHRPSDVVFILIETSEYDDQARDELQQMYDVLRKLDKNQTGKIDDEALATARRQIVEDRADAIIARLDTDKDGKISREEAKGRIQEHFDHLDANRDGFIDRDELIHAISEHAKRASK